MSTYPLLPYHILSPFWCSGSHLRARHRKCPLVTQLIYIGTRHMKTSAEESNGRSVIPSLWPSTCPRMDLYVRVNIYESLWMCLFMCSTLWVNKQNNLFYPVFFFPFFLPSFFFKKKLSGNYIIFSSLSLHLEGLTPNRKKQGLVQCFL